MISSSSQNNYQDNTAKLITTGVIVHDATSGQEQAELIATGVIVHDATPEQQPDSSWLYQIWNSLMHHLLRGHEPRIRQKRNAAGDVYYHGYDPRSGRSIHCAIETELRAWLDQLPYF